MAGIAVCDDSRHRNGLDQVWVMAVARITVWRHEDKIKNTMKATTIHDACDEHLDEMLSRTWMANHRDANFVRITVNNIDEKE